MKKFFVMAVVLAVLFLLSACSPVAGLQGFVTLPADVRVGITALVVAVVAFTFAKVISLVPFLSFLESFREPVALATAATLIGWIESAVPDAYAQVAILAIQLLLAVLAVLGVFNVLKARGVRYLK